MISRGLVRKRRVVTIRRITADEAPTHNQDHNSLQGFNSCNMLIEVIRGAHTAISQSNINSVLVSLHDIHTCSASCCLAATVDSI